MNHTMLARLGLAIPVVLVLLLLIVGPIGNTRAHAVLAQSFTPTNSNKTSPSIGPPEKVTLSTSTNLPKLSDDRRQLLDQHTDQNHHAPSIPSSGVPVQGPLYGTQTLPNMQ